MGGSFARTGLPNAVTTTAYNVNNQLTQWGTATLTYDANGNMTSSGTDGYTWDARNRLVSTLSGASFQYDPFGRRVAKTIAGTTTNYLYDGINTIQEISGGVPIANLVSSGIDEVFSRTDAAGARHFLADGLGSTSALTDSGGAIQAQYSYEPFGRTTVVGAPTSNPFQYTGRENDGTGLYFYRARYYNPTLQRFISEDPIGFAGGDANLYGYVWNNPVSFHDPLGLYTGLDDAIFAGGGLLVGVGVQAFGDLLSGQFSGWNKLAGAAIGGAVGGELLLYTGPVAAGAAAGAAGNITTQALNHYRKGCGYSASSFAAATAMGAAAGLFPGLRIPGIDVGRNSFNAVYQQMTTKLSKGTISSVSAGTAAQMAIGRAASTGLIPGAMAAATSPAEGSNTAGRSCGCQ